MKKLMITIMLVASSISLLTACASSKEVSKESSINKASSSTKQETTNNTEKEPISNNNQQVTQNKEEIKSTGRFTSALKTNDRLITGAKALKLRELCDKEEAWESQVSLQGKDMVEEYNKNSTVYPQACVWVYFDKKYPNCRGSLYHTDFISDTEVVFSYQLIDHSQTESKSTENTGSTVNLVASQGKDIAHKDVTVKMNEDGSFVVTKETGSTRRLPIPSQN